MYRRRLRAEVLLDAYSDITDTRESLGALPPGSRSMELWTHRSGSLFLDTFGRPDPNQDPPCERTSDTSVVQALHLMNSDGLQAKLEDKNGRVAKLAGGEMSEAQIIDELYMVVYSRLPTDEERQVALQTFSVEGATRQTAVEDILWALINSAEFVFNH